jgi:hypothetical protein
LLGGGMSLEQMSFNVFAEQNDIWFLQNKWHLIKLAIGLFKHKWHLNK